MGDSNPGVPAVVESPSATIVGAVFANCGLIPPKMEIEHAHHRQRFTFVLSMMAHTILVGLLLVSSRPSPPPAGANRRGQIAQRRASSATNTKPAQPDRSRQRSVQPDASKALVPLHSTTLLIPGFTFDFGKIASRAPALFPFLDLHLSIPAGPAARFRAPDSPRRRGLVFVVPAVAEKGDGLPRLRLSDATFQTIID